ncbi:NADH dehydrogenase [ubiquinone] 1 beta subcomplex subunit 11, mitochondrial [Carettochelys insculpta]|uniref:NADH dehydrogenase [ubiquinone] 1 beta subcomplex subunit 11, mitochondrial n=1 Tax=Carettochelys insculpta TaxID=44489 RepID=UPI003EC154F2
MAALGRCARRGLLLWGFPARGSRGGSGPGGGAGTAAAVVTPPFAEQPPHHEPHEEAMGVAALRKNPDYHGFDPDPVMDLWNMRLTFFFGVSLCITGGAVFLHYLPDHGSRKWARREAERLVKERERLGLPLLDSNYFDPSKLVLPDEDEE